ncbi:unnamed protein product, partial [Hymenolepis diminuta]
DPIINPLSLVPFKDVIKIPYAPNLNYFDFKFTEKVLKKYESINKRTVKIITRAVSRGYRLSVSALLSYLTYVHSLIPQGYEESRAFYLGLPSTLTIAALNIPEVNPHRVAAIPTFDNPSDGIQRVSVKVLDPIFEELLNLSRFRVLLTFTGDADKFSAAVARFREDDFEQSHNENSMSYPCYWRIIIYGVTLCIARRTCGRPLLVAILRFNKFSNAETIQNAKNGKLNAKMEMN